MKKLHIGDIVLCKKTKKYLGYKLEKGKHYEIKLYQQFINGSKGDRFYIKVSDGVHLLFKTNLNDSIDCPYIYDYFYRGNNEIRKEKLNKINEKG